MMRDLSKQLREAVDDCGDALHWAIEIELVLKAAARLDELEDESFSTWVAGVTKGYRDGVFGRDMSIQRGVDDV